jgi:LacI family gluconate utilization system Gnt-I transcriptional repressor
MTAPRKPPTMSDVARLAGVSSMTVSRAFRQDGSVTSSTQAAILAAAEELGYVFDTTASNLRSQRSNFVGAIIPSLNNANFAETVGGLSDGLKARSLQILLGYTNYDVVEEERLIEQMLRRKPEAIVLTGGRHTDRARKLLRFASIPVIETWDIPEAPIGHVVGFSNAKSVMGLVDHCVSRGLKRIAFLGGDSIRDSRGAERRAGFVTAMTAHGLDATRLVAAGEPPISMREGTAAMKWLLANLPDTEAVICVSDLSAFGALTECQRQRVEVPGQIWIMGFGDYEIGSVSVPRLTTVNPFPRRIGERAADLVLDILDQRQTEPAIIEIFPEVLVRESSG